MADTSEVTGLPAPTATVVALHEVDSSVLRTGSKYHYAVEVTPPADLPDGWTLTQSQVRLYYGTATSYASVTAYETAGLRAWGASASTLVETQAVYNAIYTHTDKTKVTNTYPVTSEYRLPLNGPGEVVTLGEDQRTLSPAPRCLSRCIVPNEGVMQLTWDTSTFEAPQGWVITGIGLARGTSNRGGTTPLWDGVAPEITGVWSWSRSSAAVQSEEYHGNFVLAPSRDGWPASTSSIYTGPSPDPEKRAASSVSVPYDGEPAFPGPLPCPDFEARWWWRPNYLTSEYVMGRGTPFPVDLPEGLEVGRRGVRVKKASSGSWGLPGTSANETEVAQDTFYGMVAVAASGLTGEAYHVSPTWNVSLEGWSGNSYVTVTSSEVFTLEHPQVGLALPWEAAPPTSTNPTYVAEGNKLRLADGQMGKPTLLRDDMWVRGLQEWKASSSYPPVAADRTLTGSWDPWEGPLEINFANANGRWGSFNGRFRMRYGYSDGFNEDALSWGNGTPSTVYIQPGPPLAPIPGEDMVFYATPDKSHPAAVRYRTSPAAQNGTRIQAVQIQLGAVENVSLGGGAPGARFRHGDEWVEATPWMRVEGEWRQAVAWVKVAGEWVQSLGGAGGDPGEATFDVVGDGRTCAGASIPADRMHLPGVDEWETGIWLSSAYGWNGERYVALRGSYVSYMGPGSWSEWYLLDLGPQYDA